VLPPSQPVIVADADSDHGRLLCHYLWREGFDSVWVASAQELIAKLDEVVPRGVILTGDLQDRDCVDLCGSLNARPGFEAAIVVVGPAPLTKRRYALFEAGAIDVMERPVDGIEFALRVRALTRELTEPQEVYRVGPLVLDTCNHTLATAGGEMAVTPSECRILKFLMMHADRAVQVESLLVGALDYPPNLGNPEIVRTHIRNLRQKIETDPAHPRILVNIPRAGYLIRS
jgi:DNA-binding response OmpR family regulator